jgi:hypothetical protein
MTELLDRVFAGGGGFLFPSLQGCVPKFCSPCVWSGKTSPRKAGRLTSISSNSSSSLFPSQVTPSPARDRIRIGSLVGCKGLLPRL